MFPTVYARYKKDFINKKYTVFLNNIIFFLNKLFFRPLSTDEAGYVLDDLSGMAPENMDPPIFVNSEGIAHSEEFQRCVPGSDLISLVYYYFFVSKF